MKKHWHIALAGLCGISFLLWLSSCARLAYDDYLFAACFKQHSFYEAIKILSNTHTFRWTTFLLQDLMFGMVPGEYYPISIFLFFACLYFLWIWQLGKLIRAAAMKFFSEGIDAVLALSLAALFVTALYFAVSQAVENFTFSGAVCDRLVPLLFITIMLNVLLKPDHGWSTYLKLGVLAFLIAGTAENSTVTLLIAIITYAGWKWILRKEKISAALIFFFIELIIFLGMELLSPGSDARYLAEKVYHFTCGDDNAYCADSLSLFLSRFFHWRQVFVLPILFLFFLFFKTYSVSIKADLRPLLRNAIKLLSVILVLAIMFHLLSVHWVFGCYGPMRIWLPVNILLLVLGICIALYLACLTSFSTKFSMLDAFLIIAIIGSYFSRHYQPTSSYRNAYDQRVSQLLKTGNKDTIVEVDPLPSADLVVEGDIMTDENDDVNRDFVDTYDLPFKVRRK